MKHLVGALLYDSLLALASLSTLGYAPSFTHKHYTRLERPARYKHSSLLRKCINYSRKKVCDIDTWSDPDSFRGLAWVWISPSNSISVPSGFLASTSSLSSLEVPGKEGSVEV